MKLEVWPAVYMAATLQVQDQRTSWIGWSRNLKVDTNFVMEAVLGLVMRMRRNSLCLTEFSAIPQMDSSTRPIPVRQKSC